MLAFELFSIFNSIFLDAKEYKQKCGNQPTNENRGNVMRNEMGSSQVLRDTKCQPNHNAAQQS
ncbi:hypothetical protein SDC9_212976 [bioreactor metagenome]|uniref:Uncharacterized protein n=1 Tax=bioreactor metagenome TaxID=1076179 RepID=A0A645JPE8_9ZZZZ